MHFLRKHSLGLWMAVGLLGLLVVRFQFIGKGGFAFGDEARHGIICKAAGHLRHGELRDFCAAISSRGLNGRPGLAVIDLPVIFAQSLLDNTSFLNPRSISIVQAWNILVVSLTAILFFRLCMKLMASDRIHSLLATAFYSLLVNTNVYLRHLLPYDIALLFFFAAMDIQLGRWRDHSPFIRALLIGLLAGIGFSIYPGYYAFIGVLLLTEIASGPRTLQAVLATILGMLAGGGSVAICLEGVARVGGSSYLRDCLFLSETITGGTFSESLTYAFKYLIEVEKITGGLMILLAVLCLGRQLWGFTVRLRSNSLSLSRNQVFIGAAFCGFLYHAISGVVFHKMVFYGRVLHMYVPFLVWAIFLFLRRLPRPVRWATLLLLVASVVTTFLGFCREYRLLAYPRDVLYRERIDILTRIPRENILDCGAERLILKTACRQVAWEVEPAWVPNSPPPSRQSRETYYTNRQDLILVNFVTMISTPEKHVPYVPPDGYHLLFCAPHYLTFPAYYFEGYGVEDRERLKARKYQVRIYGNGQSLPR
jgi:hypothetical protein